MLKHMTRTAPNVDHFRTPSNGLSDSGGSDHVTRRLITSAGHHHPMLANGYAGSGRFVHSATAAATATAATPNSNKMNGIHHSLAGGPQQLHVSLLNTSKHSQTASPSASASPATTGNHTKTTLDQSREESSPLHLNLSLPNGHLGSPVYSADRSHSHVNQSILSNGGPLKAGGVLNGSAVTMNGGLGIRRASIALPTTVTKLAAATREVTNSIVGVREMFTSLGLLCLLSLLMAILGLVFLLKMSPPPPFVSTEQVRIINPEEQTTVYEVSLALCSLSLTLDVCCCLVCAAQLLFAARLVSTAPSTDRSRDRIRKFLRDSAITRICAIAGFFVSIPVFLTDVVLYTVLQFPSTPAITTSILIGLGIIFCGFAMLHNIVLWHRHSNSKSRSSLALADGTIHDHPDPQLASIGSPIPPATLDLSALAGTPNANKSLNLHELSTLV